MGIIINSNDLKVLHREIRAMPKEYQDQLNGIELEDIAISVEKFKKEYLVLHWLNLYVGCQGEKLAKVAAELYRMYPEFWCVSNDDFQSEGKRLTFADQELFQAWLYEYSSYLGKDWGAIAWLGTMSRETVWFYDWRDNQRSKSSSGFEFIPFHVWYDIMKNPPEKILVEVDVSPEDYKVVSKGLPSVAQLYSDHGGRIAIVQDSTLDIKTEKFLKAGEIAELLQRPVKTIYNWASEGIIPCYRDGGSLRFKWAEVKEWYSQYHQKGRTSRKF